MPEQQFDLIIIGGGMVGSTLAAGLAHTDLKIALVEGHAPATFAASQDYDLRVSALSPASQSILQNLNCWQGIVQRRACPYRHMRVWEDRGTGDTRFDSQEIRQAALGHIVENRVVQLALWEQLRNQHNITLFCPARPVDIHYGAQGSRVVLHDGRSLKGTLLVGADGGRSAVREAADIGVYAEDYAQQALILSVETDYPQQNITWQRFTPSGPQAFLPLCGARASLVWYHSPQVVKRLLGLDNDALLSALYTAFPRELGGINRLVQRGAFSLRRQHALRYSKPGVVLIGDAAHTIHPLAGQGVNIGLLDAAALVHALQQALQGGRGIADAKVLAGYESNRRRHNQITMMAMDLIYRSFGNHSPALHLLRNMGLQLVQQAMPVRRMAMRTAMGMVSGLPPLAQTSAEHA